MRVDRWGNSLAVRIPGSVVDALNLQEGDEIELRAVDWRELDLVRKPTRNELIQRLRDYRGLLPSDFKFDRGEANAR